MVDRGGLKFGIAASHVDPVEGDLKTGDLVIEATFFVGVPDLFEGPVEVGVLLAREGAHLEGDIVGVIDEAEFHREVPEFCDLVEHHAHKEVEELLTFHDLFIESPFLGSPLGAVLVDFAEQVTRVVPVVGRVASRVQGGLVLGGADRGDGFAVVIVLEVYAGVVVADVVFVVGGIFWLDLGEVGLFEDEGWALILRCLCGLPFEDECAEIEILADLVGGKVRGAGWWVVGDLAPVCFGLVFGCGGGVEDFGEDIHLLF